jgi:ubiquinone/menaquinone biosynthesis C-methylase UbiE
MDHDRAGARQPERFDPAKAIRLDDPARLEYLPPAMVFELLDAPHGGTVVDFGTGTGTYAILLAKARPDLTVIGLDEQPQMLELLRKKLSADPAPNIKPSLADAKGLAALRGRADRILALNVLHELGDAALGQLAGLLAPAGQALFIDWNADVERPVGPPRDHVFAPEAARKRVEASGLAVRDIRLLRYHYALVCRPKRRRS